MRLPRTNRPNVIVLVEECGQATLRGFVSNTRNLLPWDVPLKNTDWQILQRKWPNIAESAIKKSSFNPAGKGADMGLTVKVFIGLEYECPRGHRIIASSPGKTTKRSTVHVHARKPDLKT